jgi:hypothetical protein
MSIAPTPKTAEDPDDNHRPLLDTEALLHRDDKRARVGSVAILSLCATSKSRNNGRVRSRHRSDI